MTMVGTSDLYFLRDEIFSDVREWSFESFGLILPFVLTQNVSKIQEIINEILRPNPSSINL